MTDNLTVIFLQQYGINFGRQQVWCNYFRGQLSLAKVGEPISVQSGNGITDYKLSFFFSKLEQPVGHHIFCNLNCIGSSPFSQIITNNPKVQGIGLCFVATNSSHKHFIFFMRP